MIKVDYHFHPNFTFSLGRFFWKRRAKAFWKAFERYELDAVLVAEHAYKRPRKSFEILKKYRPADAKTILIPGIEYLTGEGIDIIVFAEKEKDIYSERDLLIPWKLTLEEVLSVIKTNKRLRGIVVHPYTPGATGILKNGEEITKDAIRRLGFVEAHNCSFTSLQKFLRSLGLHKVFKGKYTRMERTTNLPPSLQLPGAVITGGSDAHHVWEIGDYMCVGESKGEKRTPFELITTKSGVMKFNKRKPYICLVVNMFTVLIEFAMKKMRLYKIDKPAS